MWLRQSHVPPVVAIKPGSCEMTATADVIISQENIATYSLGGRKNLPGSQQGFQKLLPLVERILS